MSCHLTIGHYKKHKGNLYPNNCFWFLVIIVVGAGLLSLPISSKDNTWTSYFDSLFTATSATCVTGLVLFDTYTHWSVFGQLVILFNDTNRRFGDLCPLLQRFLYLWAGEFLFTRRKLLMQSAGNTKLSGMIQLVRRIFFRNINI